MAPLKGQMNSRTPRAVVVSAVAGALLSLGLSVWLDAPVLLLLIVAPLALGAGLAARREVPPDIEPTY